MGGVCPPPPTIHTIYTTISPAPAYTAESRIAVLLSFLSRSCTHDGSIARTVRVYAHRAPRRHRHHRHPDRPVAPRGPEDPRGGQPHEVPEQPQADRPGHPQLRK